MKKNHYFPIIALCVYQLMAVDPTCHMIIINECPKERALLVGLAANFKSAPKAPLHEITIGPLGYYRFAGNESDYLLLQGTKEKSRWAFKGSSWWTVRIHGSTEVLNKEAMTAGQHSSEQHMKEQLERYRATRQAKL
jgi:hypothetical protein